MYEFCLLESLMSLFFRFHSASRFVLCIVAALCGLTVGIARGAEPTNCISIATPEWAGETNADGTGLYFELLRAVYKPLGIDLCFQIAPFNRVVRMLKNRSIDASVAFYSEEDARSIGWDFYTTSKSAVGVERLVAIFRKGLISQWSYPRSLEHLRVAWIDNYGFENPIGVALEYQRITSQQHGWKLLKAGRIDVYMDSESDALNCARECGIDLNDYRVETAVTETLHIPFAKTVRGQRFQEMFDRRMEELWQSGELAQIYQAWGHALPPRGGVTTLAIPAQ